MSSMTSPLAGGAPIRHENGAPRAVTRQRKGVKPSSPIAEIDAHAPAGTSNDR